MNKLLCLLIALIPLISYAQEVEGPEEDDKRFNPRKGHWISLFGFDATRYETYYNFQGQRKKFSPIEQNIYGGRIGFGREFSVGRGFITSSKIEGYYSGTLFEEAKTADPDYKDLEFSSYKKTSSLWGGDLVQTLGWMFEFKTRNPIMDEWAYLSVEPFIEVGIGKAKAYNRLKYIYDTTGPNAGGVEESYKHTVNDDLTNARIGAGINITGSNGFFFYVKAIQNRYDIDERKTKGHKQQNTQPIVPFEGGDPDKVESVTIYSLGGGYKF